MSDTSVPGIWSSGSLIVILAKVSHCMWAFEDEDDDLNIALPADANILVVLLDGMDASLNEASEHALLIDMDNAQDFLRSLSLYWETRT